jgi:transposase-like protein
VSSTGQRHIHELGEASVDTWPGDQDQQPDADSQRNQLDELEHAAAVRYYLQLGAAAERIAGILADRVDVSGRTILRWVQKFGPALSDEIRRYRKPVSAIWLVDETYVKIQGKWHYLYRGVDEHG